MNLKMVDRVATQIVCLTGLFVLGGCSTSIDDAGMIITNSELFACADVDYGSMEDGSGQMRAEVVAEVYEYAGGASQQAFIPMERLRRPGSRLTYGGSKPLTVPRACVTRLSGDFLFEANAGDGIISKTRHVETDVSRLIVVSVRGGASFGDPFKVFVTLPCPLRAPAVAHLRASARVNHFGSGDPTTFSATVNPARVEFAPGVTRQVAMLRVEADDPGDEFGVIATVTGQLEVATVTGQLEVAGDTVDVGCSATCVGIDCNTCQEQYEDCGDIGRAYCGIPLTSCENWPDGI